MEQTEVSVTAVLEAGMLPHMENEEAHRFTPSEVLLYQNDQGVLILDIFGLYNGYIVWLAMGYLFTVCSWTVEELREVFALLLQLPKFNPAEMLAVPTYNTIRHCSRSFRETLRTEQSLRLRSSQSLERALTPISKNVIAARLQFQCCM